MSRRRSVGFTAVTAFETPKRTEKERRKTIDALIRARVERLGKENAVPVCRRGSLNTFLKNDKPSNDNSIQPQDLLNCLDSYCDDIIKSDRKDEFADLKGFNKERYNVNLEQLETAIEKAEKIVRTEDHTGITDVHLNKALEAGTLAFADMHVLTRAASKKLEKRLSDEKLLYSPLPYDGKLSDYSKKKKAERDGQIVESFVDFKTEIKAKYDVMVRVDKMHEMEKIHELPEAKNLRDGGARSTKNSRVRELGANLTKESESCSSEYKTPPSAMMKQKNPLAHTVIMDDFLDQRARDFVEENKLIAKRRKSLLAQISSTTDETSGSDEIDSKP